MKTSKFAKVLLLGMSVGFGLMSTSTTAAGDCCYSWYQIALRGCTGGAGNSYSYCVSYYTSDLNDCYAGGGVFAPLCNY